MASRIRNSVRRGFRLIVAIAGFAAGGCDQKPVSPPPPVPAIATPAPQLPSGNSTPEGAAVDLARAFIQSDAATFRALCWNAGGKPPQHYQRFIESVARDIEDAKKLGRQVGGASFSISKVFKARDCRLKDSAFLECCTAFGVLDVRLVDIETPLWGRACRIRTLVVRQQSDQRWYVILWPDAFRALAIELYAEPDSTELWRPPIESR